MLIEQVTEIAFGADKISCGQPIPACQNSADKLYICTRAPRCMPLPDINVSVVIL